MEIKEQILQAMRQAGKPMNATEVSKATGLEKADVDKAFKDLKRKRQLYLLFVASGNRLINKFKGSISI